MGKKGITDKKLMDIAHKIGNNGSNVRRLGINCMLSSADVDSEGTDCYKVLRLARDRNPAENQKKLIRDGLIQSGFTAIADEHLPERQKHALKTNPKTSLPTKRELDLPTVQVPPAKKKPKGKSKLGEEKAKLKNLTKDLKDLQKNHKNIAKEIEQKEKEIEKSESIVRKLMEQEIQDETKKLEKRKKELDKLNLSGAGTSKNLPGNINS